MGNSIVMKLPEKPTKPYMRHNPQTLGDLRNADHGTAPWSAGAASRSATMSLRSDSLTFTMSAGELRNQKKKNAAQPRPSAANKVSGVAQPWNTISISATASDGAIAPPSRLKVQIDPWAKPRCGA